MNNPLDLRDFRFFVTVAEELHFRRAAERLGIAQPRLSLHIRQIEENLGVRLLDRTTRSVRLTKAGAQFLERARFALAQVEQAVAAVKSLAEGGGGQLRIGFTPAAAFGALPEILADFRGRHPDVGLSLSHRDTVTQIQELLEGRRDFGFVRLPVLTKRLSTLVLSRESVVVALPQSHRLAARPMLQLEDLADESIVQYAQVMGAEFQEQITGYCNRAGFKPKIVSEMGDTYSVLAMVAAGFGVAILPQWVQQTHHPRLIYHPLAEIKPIVDLALAWVTDTETEQARAFLDCAYRFARATL
jgi:DNA-binding transcriptional LysR family regulator